MAPPAGVQQQQSPERVVEELNRLHQQHFNLQWVRRRAITLSETISRVLNDFDAILRINTSLKWYYIWGKFSMVELGLSTLLKEIEEASKLLVVHPNNVNGENATVLPAMLSSKLLPEMEIDENTKREQLLNGIENLPVSMQFEKLKTIMDKIGAALEGSYDACISVHTKRLRPIVLPTIDKVQDAKIREQENLLRSAVNDGEGLRMPEDQRQVISSLPVHLVDVLTGQIFFDRIWYDIQSCFTIFLYFLKYFLKLGNLETPNSFPTSNLVMYPMTTPSSSTTSNKSGNLVKVREPCYRLLAHKLVGEQQLPLLCYWKYFLG